MEKITNLIFQGGSVKGAAYLGAIKELSKYINLNDIRRVGGASAGAITATILAMGCDIERIDELSNRLNFRDILDENPGSIFAALNTVGKKNMNLHGFLEKNKIKTVKLTNAYHLFKESGVYKGEYIREWLEQMICEQVHLLTNGKVDGTHLTFGELHDLAEQYPGVFRDLFVVGANLTTGNKVVFSYKNPQTKDLIISDAVRISISIPYLFKPHHLYYKIGGKRMMETNQHHWSDGGVYDTYPIDIFDDHTFLSGHDVSLKQAENGRFYNPQTLGFRLVSKEKKAYFENKHINKQEMHIAQDLKAFTSALAQAIFTQEAVYNRPENKERTIYIDHLNISPLAFDLSLEQRKELELSGKQATHDYLVKRFSKPSMDFIIDEEAIHSIRL